MLSGFHIRRGQAVKITGHAANPEQAWEFQEALGKQKKISKVKLANDSAFNEQKKRFKFGMTFDYSGVSKGTKSGKP